jgi:hypothetical protein
MMEMVRAWVRCGVEAYSDVTPKAAVTGGVVFALVVNLACSVHSKEIRTNANRTVIHGRGRRGRPLSTPSL